MIAASRRIVAGSSQLSYRHGAMLVAGSGMLFSFTALTFRAVEDASDWQFLTFRGGSTAVAVTLIGLAQGDRVRRDRSVLEWRVLVAGLLMGSMSMLYILALARTSAAVVAFLLATAPVWGAVFGWIVLRESISRQTVGAIAAAAAGIAIMVGGGLEAGSIAGLLLAAMIPVMLGLYNTLLRSVPDADPIAPAFVGGVAVFVGASAVALGGSGLDVSARDAALGMVSGGIFLGIGLPLFNLGHRSVPSAQISLLLMTEVVFGPLWVWIWPGETPRPATLIGGAVILAAVVFQLTSRDHSPTAEVSLSRFGAGGPPG